MVERGHERKRKLVAAALAGRRYLYSGLPGVGFAVEVNYMYSV